MWNIVNLLIQRGCIDGKLSKSLISKSFEQSLAFWYDRCSRQNNAAYGIHISVLCPQTWSDSQQVFCNMSDQRLIEEFLYEPKWCMDKERNEVTNNITAKNIHDVWKGVMFLTYEQLHNDSCIQRTTHLLSYSLIWFEFHAWSDTFLLE